MMKKSFLFSALLAAGLISAASGYSDKGFILKCNDASCEGEGCSILQKDLNKTITNFNFGDESADVIYVKNLRTTYQLTLKDLSVSRDPANHEANQMAFKIIPASEEDKTEFDAFKVTVRVYGDVHREGESRASNDPHIRYAFMPSYVEKFYNYFLKQEYEFFKDAGMTAYYNIGLNKYGEPKWNEKKKINEYFRYDDENLQKSQRYWRTYYSDQGSKFHYYDQVGLSQYDYAKPLETGKYSGSVCLNFDNTRYLDAYKAAIAAGKYPPVAWYAWSGWSDCLTEQKAAGTKDYLYQCAVKANAALSKNSRSLKGKTYQEIMQLTPRYMFSLYGLGNGVGGSVKPTAGVFWNKGAEYTSGTTAVPVSTSTCIPKTKSYEDSYVKVLFQVDGTDDNGKYLSSIKCGTKTDENGKTSEDCSSSYNEYMLDKVEIVVTPADAKCNDIDEKVPTDLTVGTECGLRSFVIGMWDMREVYLAEKGSGWDEGDLDNINGLNDEDDGLYWVYNRRLECPEGYCWRDGHWTTAYNVVTFKNGDTKKEVPLSIKIYADEGRNQLLQKVENKSTFRYNGKVIKHLASGKKLYSYMLIPNQHDKNAIYTNIIKTNKSNFLSEAANSSKCKTGIRMDARPAKFAINLSNSARVYSKDQSKYIVLDKENGAAHITNNDLVSSWDYNFIKGNSGKANKYLGEDAKKAVNPNFTPLIRNFVALDYNNEIIEGYEGNPTTEWISTTTEADGVSGIGKLDGTAQTPFALNINEGDGSAGLYSKYDAAIGKYFKFDELGGTIVSLVDKEYMSYMNQMQYCIPGSHSNKPLTTTVHRTKDNYTPYNEYETEIIGCDIALDRDPLNSNYETKTNTYAEYYNFKPFGVLVVNTLDDYTDSASYTYYADINSGDTMGARLHTTVKVVGADGEPLKLYSGGTRTVKTYDNSTNTFVEKEADGYAQDATVTFDFSEAFSKVSSSDKSDIRIYPVADSTKDGTIKCGSGSTATEDCDSYYDSNANTDDKFTFTIPKGYFTNGEAKADFILNLGRGDTAKNPIVIDINKTADALKTTTEVKFETSGGTNEKVEQKSETDGGDATFVYGSIQLSDNECYKGEKCEIEATVTIYCDDNCKADASNGDGDDEKIKELIEKLGEKYPNVDNQYGDKEINKIADNPLTDGHTNGKKGGENSGKTTFKDTYNEDNIQFVGNDVYTRALGNSAKPTKERPNKTDWHGYGSEGDVLGDEKTDDGMSKGHKTQKRITW